jgi:hypothetical protein
LPQTKIEGISENCLKIRLAALASNEFTGSFKSAGKDNTGSYKKCP